MMTDPREILATSRMGAAQFIAVSMCVFLNALDGFDVLSVSFASPGIAAEWGIDRAGLGVVLSMELIGMAVGSILIGSLADKIGRRPVILACLVIMAIGMFLASTASSVEHLIYYRLFTGLGIGGMLASTNAMVAEFSNLKSRSLAVTIMAAGYPLGAIVGGSISSVLLDSYGWRSVFVFGGAVTALTIPMVILLLPESVEYLASRRPKNALERINAIFRKMGKAAIEALPDLTNTPAPKAGFTQLFSRRLARITILLTLAYFAHIMTFYFLLKWIPKIVVDMGYSPASAGGILVWANIGGATGSILLGLLSQKIPVRGLVMCALGLAFAAVIWFGRGQSDLQGLAIAACAVGFFTNSGVTGLYAMFVQRFPTEVRAGGTGFAIGVGRGGAALGPIVAGLLFAAGASLQAVAIAMALGSLFALIAVAWLGRPRDAQSASAGPG